MEIKILVKTIIIFPLPVKNVPTRFKKVGIYTYQKIYKIQSSALTIVSHILTLILTVNIF